MINYFEAAEKTLRARGLLETALGNLERKKERILRYGARRSIRRRICLNRTRVRNL